MSTLPSSQRKIIAILSYKDAPKTQEDVGRIVKRTAIFDEFTPVGIIVDWANGYGRQSSAELLIYEDENNLAKTPDVKRFSFLLEENKEPIIYSSEEDKFARIMLGRELAHFPPTNDFLVSEYVSSFDKWLSEASKGNLRYIDQMQIGLIESYLEKANNFLKNPKPYKREDEIEF